MFENSKKLENTKAQLKEVENNKSQIQQQINNLNKTISKYNIVESEIDQLSQNTDIQNISKITIKEKPKIELDTSTKDLEEKNKEFDNIDEKVKNIFVN